MEHDSSDGIGIGARNSRGDRRSRFERAGAEKQEANLVQFGPVIIPRGEREEEEDGHQKKVGLKTRTGNGKGDFGLCSPSLYLQLGLTRLRAVYDANFGRIRLRKGSL